MSGKRRAIGLAAVLALGMGFLGYSLPVNAAKDAADGSDNTFERGDWAVTCDNTLTCRMEGATDDQGSVLITRAAGPNTPLKGELTLADMDDTSDNSPPSLIFWVDGEEKGQLKSDKGGDYPLTPAQIDVLLDAARTDKGIEFKGGKKSFVLSGDGVSAAMLKMDDMQGRIDTPGALIRKGHKPEASVHVPVPMPVIQAAKVSGKPSRALSASEARALAPRLWKSKGEVCYLHDPEVEKDRERKEKFTLTPLNDHYSLVSTPCTYAAYQGTDACWIIDSALKGTPRFVVEDVTLSYEKGIISSSAKGRGPDDCEDRAEWVWDGTAFRLSARWSTGMCRGISLGGPWEIPSYVAEVKPAE